tara:strand:- start:425 stop:625 length:201 start_codon:yes stop_codon:yes gene_type:complete
MQKSKSNKPKVICDKELLELIIKEINSLKTSINGIRIEIAKLNQIENKLKKGENIAETNGGWFSWN